MTDKMKEVRIDLALKAELLEALFKGKRVSFVEILHQKEERTITIYPPNHGVFLAHEDYMRLKRMAMASPMHYSEQEFFKKIEEAY